MCACTPKERRRYCSPGEQTGDVDQLEAVRQADAVRSGHLSPGAIIEFTWFNP
jgi:hypothetical protein